MVYKRVLTCTSVHAGLFSSLLCCSRSWIESLPCCRLLLPFCAMQRSVRELFSLQNDPLRSNFIRAACNKTWWLGLESAPRSHVWWEVNCFAPCKEKNDEENKLLFFSRSTRFSSFYTVNQWHLQRFIYFDEKRGWNLDSKRLNCVHSSAWSLFRRLNEITVT